MPQTTSISLGEMNNLNKNGSSVLIPISASDSNIADSNGTYLQLMPISSTPPVTGTTPTIADTNPIENNNTAIESMMPANEPIINDNSNVYQQDNNMPCSSQTLKNPPSTDDNWLHEANQEISLSSLFANCDSTNTELNQKFSNESNSLMSLQTEVCLNVLLLKLNFYFFTIE